MCQSMKFVGQLFGHFQVVHAAFVPLFPTFCFYYAYGNSINLCVSTLKWRIRFFHNIITLIEMIVYYWNIISMLTLYIVYKKNHCRD